MDTLKEIQERHDAVRDIEKKLLDLHQVFMDMAVLVETQGEMLDNIEIQVDAIVKIANLIFALNFSFSLIDNFFLF